MAVDRQTVPETRGHDRWRAGRGLPRSRPAAACSRSATSPHHDLLEPARPSDAAIDTVVIVMMENRSFDHWLGWLGRTRRYLEAGTSRYGTFFNVNAQQPADVSRPRTVPVSTQHMVGWRLPDEPVPGLRPSRPGPRLDRRARAQRDLGFLAPTANDDLLPARVLQGRRPAVHPTVRQAVHDLRRLPLLAARAHLPEPRATCTPRSRAANKSNAFPTGPDGFDWPTIWDRLGAANVPADVLRERPAVPRAVRRADVPVHPNPIDDYYTTAPTARCPTSSCVDPAFFGAGQNDDHPLADVRAGQAFQRRRLQGVRRVAALAATALFISTYDEWGGFFDHVAPPHFPDDRANAVDSEDFSQAGFRVPTVLASPYARPGLVDDRTYDHTSILRFLEWRFLGAPPEGPGNDGDSWFLTRRDRYALNLGASLSATVVDADIGLRHRRASDRSAVTGLWHRTGGLSAMARSVLEANDPAFDEGRWRTYLDKVGYKLG